jgi:hypothetical protein
MTLAVCMGDVRTSFLPSKCNCSVVLHEIAVTERLKLPVRGRKRSFLAWKEEGASAL